MSEKQAGLKAAYDKNYARFEEIQEQRFTLSTEIDQLQGKFNAQKELLDKKNAQMNSLNEQKESIHATYMAKRRALGLPDDC